MNTLEIFSGLTWFFVFLSIVGNILVIYEKRTAGYFTWLLANTGWICYNIFITEYSQMTLFVIYSLLAILGVYKEVTKKKEPSVEIHVEP